MKETAKIINIIINKLTGIRNKLTGDKGAIAVIFALLLVVIIGMAAFVIDEGSLYQTRRSIQTIADAAALAGVQELPENPDIAIQKAIEYAALNNFAITSSDVTISNTYVNNDTITVNAINPNAQLYLARIFGQDSAIVGANASAVIGSPSQVTGVVPWGFTDSTYTPGVEYTLKFGSPPDLASGSFGGLAIGGNGASTYNENIIVGSTTPLSVGMWVDAKTGNMAGPTAQGTSDRIYNQLNNQLDIFSQLVEHVGSGANSVYKLIESDSQFIIVPWVSAFSGGSHPVQILGFLQFVITYAQGSVVKGTFINKAILDTDQDIIGVDSSGLRVIRLIQ